MVHQPIQGETVCGDAYGLFECGDFVLAVVVDGLGHGPDAHAASEKAIGLVAANPRRSVESLLRHCHEALRTTRGAVMGVARIDRHEQKMVYGGVGNIEARLVGADKVRRPVSTNGIIGYNARIFKIEVHPYVAGDMLLMHSDGISDGFSLPVSARGQDPQLLAFQIAAAHGRLNDDQLLLIVTEKE
ncbi:MAG: SpoIIE family protein phosphatase [Sideroxyarcus sp.]|nr:SpoIIE family protein phosphatase [Sideroxyarcus sp.]